MPPFSCHILGRALAVLKCICPRSPGPLITFGHNIDPPHGSLPRCYVDTFTAETAGLGAPYFAGGRRYLVLPLRRVVCSDCIRDGN